MTDTYEALIARLGTLQGPDRMAECAIYKMLIEAGKLRPEDPIVKHYTASIDAALTSAPEGWRLANLWEAANPKDRPWCGAALRRDTPYRAVKALGAKTLPLAVCIACLRARQADKEDGVV